MIVELMYEYHAPAEVYPFSLNVYLAMESSKAISAVEKAFDATRCLEHEHS